MKQTRILALTLALTACGSSDDDQEQQVNYASFTTEDVQAFIDSRNYTYALKIIREQGILGVADLDDALMLVEIHLARMEGIAAEVAIDRAREMGAEKQDTAISLAKAFIMQRRFETAKDELQAYVFTKQDAYDALLLRADIARETGEVDEARILLQAAIDDQPKNFRGYIGLSLLEFGEGEYVGAESLARQAASLSEEDPIIEYALGASSRYQFRFEEAKQHLSRAIELQPENVLSRLELAGIYIEENEFEAARKQLDFVYSKFPHHQMAQFYSALMLATEGEFQKAEELLVRTTDLIKYYPPAIRAYGHLSFRLGKVTTAQPYLKKFLDMVPQDRLTRLALAECYNRRGEPLRAMKLLGVLLEDETDLEAHLQAAASAGMQGNILEAKRWLEKVDHISQGEEGQHVELIDSLSRRLALSRFMQGDMEASISQLKQMYGEDRGDFTSLILLANIQMRGEDVFGAEETALKLLELLPEKPIAHNLMGAVRYRQGRLDDAIGYYNTALDHNPDYVSALKNRALVYVNQRDFKKALPDLEKAFDQVPTDGHTIGMLGRTYLELGHINEAVGMLAKAESYFPHSAVVMADHAEALAAQGYTATALAKAIKARKYAGDSDAGFTEYLTGKIEGWEAIEDAKLAADEAVVKEIEATVAEKMKIKREAAENLKAEEEAKRQAEEAAEVAEEEAGTPSADSEDDADDTSSDDTDASDEKDEGDAPSGDEKP